MSWETNKVTVVNALKALGYKEVPLNVDIEKNPDSLDHYHFTLDPVDIDSRNVTSSNLLTSDIVEMRIAYKIKDKESKETVYDKFKTAVETVFQLAICLGLEGSLRFEKKEGGSKKYIGTQRFYIGAKSC